MLQQMQQQMLVQQQMIQQLQQQLLLQQQYGGQAIGGAPGLGLNVNAQSQLGGGLAMNPLLMGGYGLGGGMTSGFPYSAAGQSQLGAHAGINATAQAYPSMYVPSYQQ